MIIIISNCQWSSVCGQVVLAQPFLTHLEEVCRHHYLHLHLLLYEIWHRLQYNTLNFTCLFFQFQNNPQSRNNVNVKNNSVIPWTINNPIITVVIKIKIEFFFLIDDPRYINMLKHHICDRNIYDVFYCLVLSFMNNNLITLGALDLKIIWYIILILILIIPNPYIEHREDF